MNYWFVISWEKWLIIKRSSSKFMWYIRANDSERLEYINSLSRIRVKWPTIVTDALREKKHSDNTNVPVLIYEGTLV
jgi:hypothetical protein